MPTTSPLIFFERHNNLRVYIKRIEETETVVREEVISVGKRRVKCVRERSLSHQEGGD